MADINAAIKEATAAAGEIIDAEVENLPSPAHSQASAQVVQFQKPSMETMGNSVGIANSVDLWLKVQAEGLKIGAEKGLVEKIVVSIDMTEDKGFFVKQSIKWGQPVTYASSYDGVSSDKGGSWGDQLAMVRGVAPTAKPFPSADIIMVTDKAIKLKEKTIDAGAKLGHTLSMSNWSAWAEFFREVAAAGKVGQTVKVEVEAEEVNGSNGYTWGVVNFKLLD